MNRFLERFGARKPVIGMIHLPALPDYTGSPGIDAIVAGALDDIHTLADAGFDGALIENEHDRPHRVRASADTVDAMTVVTRAAVDESVEIAVGCEILLHDPQASLTVAKDAGASFIRTDYFVDRMSRPGYGEFDIDPEALLGYRGTIGADEVLILADIQVKYATMLDDRSIAESARLASEHGADAVVVTGDASGHAPLAEAVSAAAAATTVPVLIGSGLDAANASELLDVAGGAIVGTSLMRDGRVDAVAANELIRRARG